MGPCSERSEPLWRGRKIMVLGIIRTAEEIRQLQDQAESRRLAGARSQAQRRIDQDAANGRPPTKDDAARVERYGRLIMSLGSNR